MRYSIGRSMGKPGEQAEGAVVRGGRTDRVVGAGGNEDIVGVAVWRDGGGRSRQSGQVGKGVGAALFWHGWST